MWAGPLFPGHVCSVGYEVLDWITEYTCHGVGDIQGQPWEGDLDLDDEMRDFIIETYRIDPKTGKLVYTEAVLSRAKGRAKSELAGVLAVAEALGPVRFSHWDEDGQPVGRTVTSPLIKCLATEENQAGNTFQNVAYIFEWGQEHHPDIYGDPAGFRQYQSATAIYLPGGGEIRATTSGAASKDGGLETFVVADETHLYITKELRDMYATISRNLGKRPDAQSWLLQTSTAYHPGEESVFEQTLTMHRLKQLPPTVYVNHVEGRGRVDLDDKEWTLKQLREAYGAASSWIDLDRKFADMKDPRKCKDDEEAARYFLNRPLSSKNVWLAKDIFEKQKRDLGKGDFGLGVLPPGTKITLGFDGSLSDDATVLIASRMSDGWIWPIGIWAKPSGPAGNFWEVPRTDVLETVREAYRTFNVQRGYFDPHEWRSDIDDLAREFGEERVLRWETSSWTRMSSALDNFRTDLISGRATHSGAPLMVEHAANAYVSRRGRFILVRKESPKSSRKIDALVGAVLAYEARRDVLVANRLTKKSKVSHTFYGFS